MHDDEDETEEQIRARAEGKRRREAWQAARKAYLSKLFGSDEPYDWHVPQPVTDFDAQLGEHIAQLRNTVRYTLGTAIDEDASLKSNHDAAGAIDRMIRTNLAIIKVLKTTPPSNSKTVRCGQPHAEQQD